MTVKESTDLKCDPDRRRVELCHGFAVGCSVREHVDTAMCVSEPSQALTELPVSPSLQPPTAGWVTQSQDLPPREGRRRTGGRTPFIQIQNNYSSNIQSQSLPLTQESIILTLSSSTWEGRLYQYVEYQTQMHNIYSYALDRDTYLYTVCILNND